MNIEDKGCSGRRRKRSAKVCAWVAIWALLVYLGTGKSS